MLDFLPLIIIEAHECLLCCRVIDDRLTVMMSPRARHDQPLETSCTYKA